jgi:hypothetical protein
MEPGLAHIHLSWSRQVPVTYHGAWPGTHSFIMEAGQVPIAQSFVMKPGQVHIHSPWSLARNTFIHHGARSSKQSFYENLRPVYKKTLLWIIERYLLAFLIYTFKFSIVFIRHSVLLIAVQHTHDFDFKIVSGQVVDRTDGKLVHLDGLNFSRAWALYNIATRSHMLSLPGRSSPIFFNFQGAQESIPRNQFRQPKQPGGPVRKLYSYSVPSPHRLFKISGTVEIRRRKTRPR